MNSPSAAITLFSELGGVPTSLSDLSVTGVTVTLMDNFFVCLNKIS